MTAFVNELAGEGQRLRWFPVNKTLKQWRRDVGGGYTVHQGTLLRFESGVFVMGLIGSMLVGTKREDGTIEPTAAGVFGPDMPEDGVILEAADPYYGDHGCRRLLSGEIECNCPDDL